MNQKRNAHGRFMRRLTESATAQRVEIREVGGKLGEASGSGARYEAVLIRAGWGSSGFYSRELLARDGAKAFPAGTHMHLDHPTRTESVERPERSVKDLAGRIASTPHMQGDELRAEIEVFPTWRPVVEALVGTIGLSIVAYGESEHGNAEGRDGDLITALTEGESVDFVTRAGAGGKIGKLIESARGGQVELDEARNAGNWLEARIHSMFSEVADRLFGEGHVTRDERIGLSSAIGDALTAFNAAVTEQVPSLYSRDPFADPEADVQVTEAAGSGRPTNKEADMADDKRLSELEEKIGKLDGDIATLTEDRDKEKTRAERAEDALLTRDADRIVREAKTEVEGKDKKVSVFEGLPERAVERAIKSALADKLPLTEDGKLDRDRLAERAAKAAKEERDYLSEGAPASVVRDMGPGGAGGDVTEADETKLAESFQRLGMGENAAKLAAGGR